MKTKSQGVLWSSIRFATSGRRLIFALMALMCGMALQDSVQADTIPAVTKPTVRLCYLIPTNRTAQVNGVAIFQSAFLTYREWCREQQEEYGFGSMTFNLETEADGWTPKVWVVNAAETDSYLASNMWGNCMVSAHNAGVPTWEQNQTWFIIGETHIMQPDGSVFGHNTGGGNGSAGTGLAVLSGDFLALAAPKYLTNNTAYNGLILPEIGPRPLVYGVSYDTSEGNTLSTLGGTYNAVNLHEFMHGFHLHHDFRNEVGDFGNAMGNGCRIGMRGYIYPTLYTNDYTRQTYGFASQLSLSRFFNPNRTVTETTGPVISNVSTGVVTIVGGKVKLDLTVTDPSGLGLALLLDVSGSYGGGVLMEQRLSGTSNTITFLNPFYSTNCVYTNAVRVQDIFGNETETNIIYRVNAVANCSPWANIKIQPPRPAVGQNVSFDASGSSDPDDVLSSVNVEWDFNNDGTYDTAPMPCTTVYVTNFPVAGVRQVKVRVTDPHGASFVSTPLGMRVGMVTHYAWTNSPSPMAPYDSWIKAARTLQAAVNAAGDGDTVVVAPGVYQSGGAVAPGSTLTNRLCITNAITVRADAGPDQTFIVGNSSGGSFGLAAVRCAYVGSNAVLTGFTLTNGWTMASGDGYRDQSGGGALVMGGTVSNCTIRNNAANVYGGGAGVYYGGAVINSTLANNDAQRGAGVDFEYSGGTASLVKWCEIRNNTAINYGGGVYCRGVGLVANSLIYSNTAGKYGGGVHLAYTSRVENCAIYANSATDTVTYGMGGGVMSEFNGGEVRSCTVADNTAGRQGGGIYIKDGAGTVVNSIIYFNSATSGANWQTNAAGAAFTYSCTTSTNPLPSGVGCTTGDPQFANEAAHDYRLGGSESPAFNTGLNSSWASNALDVAGNPRINSGTIDMGAYEVKVISVPGNTLSFDGANDYVEVLHDAVLKPTNSLTAEAWVYSTDWTPGANQTILGCTETGGYSINIMASGMVQAYVRLNGAYLMPQYSAAGLVAGWHHVAVACDGRYAQLYVDGELRDTRDAGAYYPISYTNNNSVIIGAEASTGTGVNGGFFQGQIDEVRIWNVARRGDEIRDAMHRALMGYETGLAAYFAFNHSSSSTLLDLTAHGNDGTLVNGPAWVASTYPCTTSIANRTNLRAAWIGRTNSLASGRLSVSDGDVAGGDFVVFGHNNAAETENASDKPGNVQWRLNRVWQVDESGSLTADLRFDVTGWPNTFALLVDADGVFSNATVILGGLSGTNFTATGVGLQDGYFYTLGSVALPDVSTDPVTGITTNSAQCGGTVASAGSSPITAKGLAWSTTSSSPFDTSFKTDHGAGTGSFSDVMSPLTPGQSYYVRAYASNSLGVTYGVERIVTLPMAASGNVLAFDGINGYVTIADCTALDLTNNYTLECWFKADGFGSLRGLIDKYQSSNAYLLRLTGTDLDFDQMTTTNLNLQAGKWYHAAAVNSNGTRRLYLNGTARTLTGTPLTVQANSDPLCLASDYGGRYFDGQMEEVRIWSVVRSEDEIRDSMHHVLSGSETGLVAYYRFDQINSTALIDVTGNGNDGTAVNGIAWTNSTFPCAVAITNRLQLRGAWSAQATTFDSDRFSVSNAGVSGSDFAIFGHDNATDGLQNTSDTPSNTDWRVTRVWQTELAGAVSGTVRFDTTGLADVGDGSRLCVLADADGFFTNATVVNGSFSTPVFTASSQALGSNAYYTLAKLGAFPGVTTAPITNVMATCAVSGGEVTNEGASAVIARGVCWNTTGTPTTADNHTLDGSGLGVFISDLTNLLGGYTYYVRAYAGNSSGTGYGQQRSFTAIMTPPGNSLNFDGANDYVSIADCAALDLTNNYTLECWFKADGFGGARGLISKYQTGGANGYILRLNGAELDFDQLTTTGLNLQTGRWYHVAAVNSNGTRSLSVNGLARTISGTVTPVQANADELRLGSDYNGRYFDGVMDEVRIWNVARTPDDIRDAMHHVVTGTETGLVAYYRCDHISGTALADFTNNGRDGTLLNGPFWTNSTFPCAATITNRLNLRGAWLGQTNSLTCSILSVTSTVVAGTDYRVFGHDGGALTSTVLDKPAVCGWRLNRAWQMEGTGALTGGVVFDCAGITNLMQNTSRLTLLTDADGGFSNATVVAGSYNSGAQVLTISGQSLSNGFFYTLAEGDWPVVTTAPIANIISNSAQCGGNVTMAGASSVTARGCVWNTNGSPTVESHEGITSDGSGPGSFMSQLTGLAVSRTYYVRAYAVNSQGTSYGVERSFTSAMIPPGNALVFDGANDCVSLPPALATSVGGAEAITIEYWFKGSQLQSPVRFQDGDGWIVAGWSATSPQHIISTDGGTAGISVGAEGTVENGQWHHLAMTWQRNTTNGFKSYLDGVLVAQRNSASNALPSLSSATPYLGCQSGSSEFLAGCLDEVRIWSVVRSQDEIRDQMHKELSGTETGLVAYYRFNQLAGTTAFDGATNGYDGTLVNGPVWTNSTMPCAAVIADRFQVRGAWAAKTNSLASGRLALTNGVVTGTGFAIFGHDNATESQNASDKPALADWRLNRVWRVEQTGAVPADLQFDTTGFAGPFALLVDADGVFSNSTLVSGFTDNGTFTASAVSLTNGTYYTLGRINAPVLTTSPISNVSWYTATAGGNVTNQGGSTVTARGCVWSKTPNPTVEIHEGVTTDGSGLGAFSSSLTGLVAECTYYVRAYAVNTQGTAYGAEQTLTTLRSLAQVTTVPVSNITYYAAQCGGNVTNEGQTAVTAAGVCWNTTGSPTITNSHTTDSSGLGAFSSTLTGIVERQTYYVRAYAVNSIGATYGDERSFTAPMIPPGNCLDFDGFNDMAGTLVDASPAATTGMTVEAWVRLNDVSRDSKVVSGGSSSYWAFCLGVSGGKLYPELWDTAGTRSTLSAGTVPAGQWVHLAFVYQRNTALIAYINGAEVGRTNVTDRDVRSNNGRLNFGVDPTSFANYMAGRLDEVRVWHVARTEDQIRDNMHRTLTGSEAGLTAFYNFDKTSGDTISDMTGTGSYSMLNKMDNSDWVKADWPCAHLITGQSNLRAIWIARTNSLGSSILSIAQTNISGSTYAVVGNDGSALEQNFTDRPASLYWRLARSWQTENGGVSNGTVQFDCSGLTSLISDSALLRLLVDNDGVYTNATVLTGSYTNGLFTVAGQPFTNGVFFTLGELVNLPGVTTAPVSNVSPFSAACGGAVTIEGPGGVSTRGVCWNTTGSPTTNDYSTASGSGQGAFSISLTNLAPSTPYYVRAYAVNAAGVGYGAAVAFTTLTAFAQVTTAPISNITQNSAQSGGNVTNEGGYAVTVRGLCWSLAGGPTTNDAHTTDGSGLGAFVSQLTGLSGLQTYHVRSYAINSAGVSYGNEQTLSTLITPPGNALDFNDSSVANGCGLMTNFVNRITLECWVYHDDLTNRTSRYVTVEPEVAVIRHDSGNNGRLHTYFKLNGSLRALTVDNVLQTGRWYHVAGVWDSTNINLYLNGMLLTNANFAGMTMATNSGNVSLGNTSEYLNGRLDEVRIWNAGRTQSEIRDSMHKQLSGTETGLAAYFPCNEGSGSTATGRVSGVSITNLVNVGWAASTFPCASVIENRNTLRGVWRSQTNSWSSSILSVSNAVASGTDFRVFGHDSGTLTNNMTDKPAAYAWRLNRAWQVEGTGALTGTVVFDCSGLGGIITNTADLRMLVDADGVFTNATAVAGIYTDTTKTFTISGQSLSNGFFYTLAEGGWPTVTTYPVSNILHAAATGGGNVTATGASAVTERGVCWNKTSSPSTADSHSSAGSGTGGFVSGLTALSPQTLYYVRAYAVNAQGTGYGDERTFTTLVAPPGNALAFDGTNDYVSIPDHNQLDMTNNYTLECWFKADNFGTAGNLRGLIDKYQTSGAAGYLLRLNGGELDFEQLLTSGLNLQSNRWYHAAAVNSNGTRTLYVNGLARTISGTSYTVLANTNELRLGCDYSSRYFNGQMDEVRIWNVVRSEAEIRDSMHQQLSGSEPGLVAYYNFNATTGTVLFDITTNSHSGMLTNGPVWTNSTIPCANLIASTNNLRGAWNVQSNALASSILSVSNSAVTGVFYRVFGHDGNTLTNTTLDRPDAFAWRLNRAWQVEGTGTFSGTFAFDCSSFTSLVQNTSRLRLLVDSDGTFADAIAVPGAYGATVFMVAGQAVPQGGFYTIGEYGTRTITASAGPHGAISPSNAIVVMYGDSTNLVVTPNALWHIGDVATNGTSVGAVTAFTWSNVTADGVIAATFAANLATQGTPQWWLAQYGLTNGASTFDQAETNYSDGDTCNNGQEYLADTDPTNPASYFKILSFSNSTTRSIRFLSSSNRLYTMNWCSNLVNGVWTNVPGAGPRVGAGGADVIQDTNVPTKGPFYRLKVELP